MHNRPDLWAQLMDKLVQQVVSYLQLQISAGVEAVQLFDTWVGNLSIQDYTTFVHPYLETMLQQLGTTVPVIYFGTGNSHLLPSVSTLPFDVLAFDWRTPLVATWELLGCKAVQGNLDPIILCAEQRAIGQQAGQLLREVAGRGGHIFNLGHGIIPETPVDNVKFLVDFVHQHSAR